MEEEKKKNSVVLKTLEALKNSKTDEEFNENLKKYTMKLSEMADELDKEKELNKTLRNQNRMLSIEVANQNIELAKLQILNDNLTTLQQLEKETVSPEQESSNPKGKTKRG